MKKPLIIALCAVAALAFVPVTHAGSKERAVIGGFVGGLIVGHTLGKHAPAPICHETVSYHPHRRPAHGHWETNRVKVWVPGHWTVRIDRCGTRVRHYVAGRYEWRTERVWVAYAPSHRSHGRIAYAR
ncbi:MAG: hypothetical protein KIT44_10845 [Opitutaceae bacterium]|nr:hypothetical protein [Opitutaceae bacterium]